MRLVVFVCVALFALAGSACGREPPALVSCAGPLSGVWLARTDGAVAALPLRGDERLGFDVRDEAGGIAVYPLWDSSRPAGGKTGTRLLSPWRITLTRSGGTAVGTVAFRQTQDGHTCLVKQPARLSACHNREAMLELTLADRVDASTCAVAAPPTRLAFTLERQ